jgi:hypothetical protein
MTRRNTNIAAVVRNFGKSALLVEWFTARSSTCAEAVHGRNNLSRRSNRHHHVRSVFARFALARSKCEVEGHE